MCCHDRVARGDDVPIPFAVSQHTIRSDVELSKHTTDVRDPGVSVFSAGVLCEILLPPDEVIYSER